MKAVLTFANGSLGVQGFTSSWNISTYNAEYDTYTNLITADPPVGSTAVADFISDLKDAAIVAIEAVSGPTLTHSDICVLGGPAI